MTVIEVNSVSVDPDRGVVAARLRVSKGSYIRSLAELVGEHLGVPAHLHGLRRTASGPLGLAAPGVVGPLVAMAMDPDSRGAPRWRVRAQGMETSAREDQGDWLRERLIPAHQVLPFPLLEVDAELFRRLGHGQTVPVPGIPAGQARLAARCPDLDGLLVCGVPGDGTLKGERTIIPVGPVESPQQPQVSEISREPPA